MQLAIISFDVYVSVDLIMVYQCYNNYSNIDIYDRNMLTKYIR